MVAWAFGVECGADRCDTSVHHVAGRHDVGTGVGVARGGAGDQLDARVVVDLAVHDNAAVAVVGVRAQAHVGDHDQVRRGVFDRADCGLHDAVASA